ncbi:hypothetical protein [Chitinibacter sp. GC72]|uniref:hypothetical protein n=1 Tax=Chitinibacter sp. GC72 TaxID=1526917 RepID=UPI0012F72753|nr:hypothetical protein [Chitinibacter sp. GC72]
MKKVILWMLSCGATLFSLFCLLALLQAGSIYSAERALFNLKFWGALLVLGILGALFCAYMARQCDKQAPSLPK